PYATAAADHIGIPIHFYTEKDDRPGWTNAGITGRPEPVDTLADRGAEMRCYSEMTAHSRVAFHGEGPDNALLYEWRPHLAYLQRHQRWIRIAADVAKHMRRHKRIPLLPTIP